MPLKLHLYENTRQSTLPPKRCKPIKFQTAPTLPGFNRGRPSGREEATVPSAGTPRSVPTSAPRSPPSPGPRPRPRPTPCPEPTSAHRSLAPARPAAQPLSHSRLSPRRPPAHRRLLTQLLSRLLPAATPDAAPPSRQLLLPPASRSSLALPSPARRRRACAVLRQPGRSPGAVSRIFPCRHREGGRRENRWEALAAPSAGAPAPCARGKAREAGGALRGRDGA
ncbi:keratinocyte proline-rich protein-like [Chamaea fasciata]|uniref:keratinocyte proline-rich protein-like n=1 Tax=Chamaea fasciata TaxID=190680 RepID=UPI00336AD8EA